MQEKNLLLSEAHDSEVKAYCAFLGYEFSNEDIADLRAESYMLETVEHAVNDYLNAYER